MDVPGYEIITDFPHCIEFINAAKASNGKILVHWYDFLVINLLINSAIIFFVFRDM